MIVYVFTNILPKIQSWLFVNYQHYLKPMVKDYWQGTFGSGSFFR